MEAVLVCCRECNSHLGTLLNLWTQIGKGRISPVIQDGTSWEISPAGAIGQGERGAIVDSCRVQEVLCDQCRSILGSRCLSSPVNHVLHEGQLLLRTSSIQIKDLQSHVTIKPTIQRKLSLKNPPTDKLQPEDHDHCDDDNNLRQPMGKGPGIGHILNDIDAQREEIERLDAVGYQVVTSFNQAVHHINDEVGKLKGKMAQMTDRSLETSTRNTALENDIISTKAESGEIKRAIQSLVAQDHLEQQSLSMRNAIEKVDTSLRVEFSDRWEKHQQKFDLLESKLESARLNFKEFQILLEGTHATAKTALAATDVATEEIVALKAEVQHLRRALTVERSYNASSASPVFASREIDILTSNITTIGHRASQVETLRMEFELLKGRVQRVETQTFPVTSQRNHPTSGLQRREPQHSESAKPKRKASYDRSMEDDIDPSTPSSATLNVRNNHVAWSSPSDAHPAAALDSPPPAKASRNAARAGIPKLTRSGAVDKRTLKRRGSKPTTTVRKVKG